MILFYITYDYYCTANSNINNVTKMTTAKNIKSIGVQLPSGDKELKIVTLLTRLLQSKPAERRKPVKKAAKASLMHCLSSNIPLSIKNAITTNKTDSPMQTLAVMA